MGHKVSTLQYFVYRIIFIVKFDFLMISFKKCVLQLYKNNLNIYLDPQLGKHNGKSGSDSGSLCRAMCNVFIGTILESWNFRINQYGHKNNGGTAWSFTKQSAIVSCHWRVKITIAICRQKQPNVASIGFELRVFGSEMYGSV